MATGDFKGLLESISVELVPKVDDFQLTYGITLEDHQKIGLTFKRLAAYQLYYKALKGDLSAIKEISDRVHGKSKPTSDELGGETYENYLGTIDEHDKAVASGEIEERKAVAIVDEDADKGGDTITIDPHQALRNAGFM